MQMLFFMDVAALCGGSWTCAVRGGAVPGSLGGVRRWPSEVVCGPVLLGEVGARKPWWRQEPFRGSLWDLPCTKNVQRGSQGENIKTTFFFGKTNFK